MEIKGAAVNVCEAFITGLRNYRHQVTKSGWHTQMALSSQYRK